MVYQPNLQEIKILAASPESFVKVVEQQVTVMAHPMYSRNLRKGIIVELDALLNRYSAVLGGLPLAYDSPKLVSVHGWLFHTNPFNHLLVSARFYVFAPEVGGVVQGVVKKKSQNHLGCLVHGTFNVSVPRPQDFSRLSEVWRGNEVEEGDSVRLRLVEIKLGYYLPFFKAELDPESVEEAVRARKGEPGKRIIFSDDSGISSNEADDSVNKGEEKQKSKLKNEGESSTTSAGGKELTGMSDTKEKKIKKKKVKKEIDPEKKSPEDEGTPKQKKMRVNSKEHEKVDILNIKKESLVDGHAVQKKKRKRTDDETLQEKQEDERPSKKKRKLQEDHLEENIQTTDSPKKVKREKVEINCESSDADQIMAEIMQDIQSLPRQVSHLHQKKKKKVKKQIEA